MVNEVSGLSFLFFASTHLPAEVLGLQILSLQVQLLVEAP